MQYLTFSLLDVDNIFSSDDLTVVEDQTRGPFSGRIAVE